MVQSPDPDENRKSDIEKAIEGHEEREHDSETIEQIAAEFPRYHNRWRSVDFMREEMAAQRPGAVHAIEDHGGLTKLEEHPPEPKRVAEVSPSVGKAPSVESVEEKAEDDAEHATSEQDGEDV